MNVDIYIHVRYFPHSCTDYTWKELQKNLVSGDSQDGISEGGGSKRLVLPTQIDLPSDDSD